jgi:hypothetical protein
MSCEAITRGIRSQVQVYQGVARDPSDRPAEVPELIPPFYQSIVDVAQETGGGGDNGIAEVRDSACQRLRA